MKKNKKEEPYRVRSMKFIGGEFGFTYEITLNKSLVHTGKLVAIEKGLNSYDKKEPFKIASRDLKNSFRSFLYGIKNLF